MSVFAFAKRAYTPTLVYMSELNSGGLGSLNVATWSNTVSFSTNTSLLPSPFMVVGLYVSSDDGIVPYTFSLTANGTAMRPIANDSASTIHANNAITCTDSPAVCVLGLPYRGSTVGVTLTSSVNLSIVIGHVYALDVTPSLSASFIFSNSSSTSQNVSIGVSTQDVALAIGMNTSGELMTFGSGWTKNADTSVSAAALATATRSFAGAQTAFSNVTVGSSVHIRNLTAAFGGSD